MRVVILGCLVLVAGCGENAPPPAPVVSAKGSSHEDGHDHSRETMLLTDAGPYHAGLTAHFSADQGNELDITFETIGKDPQPVALPIEKFIAEAKRTRDGMVFTLEFEPAPASERPENEPAGSCSHFVAKAPWLHTKDELTVSVDLEIRNKIQTVVWNGFIPEKYAHHPE